MNRALAAYGAILAAVGVALSAYASHGAGPGARERLFIAAFFAFGHGVALACMPQPTRPLGRAASLALAAGVLLFSGSLVLAVFAGIPPALAPAGGSLLIAAWLVLAIDRVRG